MIDHARLVMIFRMLLNTSVNFHLWYPGKFRIMSNKPIIKQNTIMNNNYVFYITNNLKYIENQYPQTTINKNILWMNRRNAAVMKILDALYITSFSKISDIGTSFHARITIICNWTVQYQFQKMSTSGERYFMLICLSPEELIIGMSTNGQNF